jgi:hypothetical protein
VDKDRRLVLPLRVPGRTVNIFERFVDIADQIQKYVCALGNIKVGPANTLYLCNFTRRRLGMVVVGDFECSLDMYSFLGVCGLGGRSSHAEIEASVCCLTFILTASLRDLVDSYWAVFLVLPVIAAFNGTSLELFGDPTNQPSPRSPTDELLTWQ